MFMGLNCCVEILSFWKFSRNCLAGCS